MKILSLVLVMIATVGLNVQAYAATKDPTTKTLACSCSHKCASCDECKTDHECDASENS